MGPYSLSYLRFSETKYCRTFEVDTKEWLLVNFIFALQLQSWAAIQSLLTILIGNKIG